MPLRSLRFLACLLLLLLPGSPAIRAGSLDEAPVVSFDQPGLTADQLGVIVNDDDPNSVGVGAYYEKKRGIPGSNMIHVRFSPSQPNLPQKEFARVKRIVDRATPAGVQAYALTWTQPYRVDCMSITAAFAFGFDQAYCATGCQMTRASPYFNSQSALPYNSFRIRPTMSLASYSLEETRKLIDRGVESDGKNPEGSAYLVSTSDKNRNVRSVNYEKTRSLMRRIIPTEIGNADFIQDKRDVMFYFTGLANVSHLQDNTYLPGAMADHLTSAGGDLLGSGQMSILKWIEAGATGSYGAVAEPCNFLQKFPMPPIAMAHYLQGETLIEAYWKSVAMPGQGIFVGEPLARPFSGFTSTYGNDELRVEMRVIPPGIYSVQHATSMVGPYREVGKIQVGWGARELKLKGLQPGYARFVRLTAKTQDKASEIE